MPRDRLHLKDLRTLPRTIVRFHEPKSGQSFLDRLIPTTDGSWFPSSRPGVRVTTEGAWAGTVLLYGEESGSDLSCLRRFFLLPATPAEIDLFLESERKEQALQQEIDSFSDLFGQLYDQSQYSRRLRFRELSPSQRVALKHHLESLLSFLADADNIPTPTEDREERANRILSDLRFITAEGGGDDWYWTDDALPYLLAMPLDQFETFGRIAADIYASIETRGPRA